MRLERWAKFLHAAVVGNGVSTVGGSLSRGAIAAFIPQRNVIVVDEGFVGKSPRASAAILAHEAVHADQFHSRRYAGRDGYDCVSREVEATLVERGVWHAFWNGFGPNTSPLERYRNAQLRVFTTEGEPGLYRLVVTEPDYQKQCDLFAP